MVQSFDETNWRTDKILDINEAAKLAADFKAQGKKIVTVNGSFDLVHAGHLDQLEEAKKQGDILFVGLNSDESIRNEKGDTRPLIPEQARAALLVALTCVDYVIIIDEAYSEVHNILLRAIKSDVHVNGPDYGEPETWVEWPAMQEVGATGYTVARRNNLSTTDLLARACK